MRGFELVGMALVMVDDLEHRIAVGRVTLIGTHRLCDSRRLQIGLAGHQGRYRAGIAASHVGVIGHPERHQHRAEIRVAQAEFAEAVSVLADFGGGIRGVIDQDILRGDHHVDGVAKGLDVELAAIVEKLEQVERRQVAGRVVQMHVLAARVRGVDPAAVGAGMPGVDGGIELHPGVAAAPGRFGDHPQQVARMISLRRLRRRARNASAIRRCWPPRA